MEKHDPNHVVDEGIANDLLGDLGELSSGRRLSDKILTAFNHAYAQDRRDIADMLLQALNQCRETEGAERVSGALEQARLWMRYVQIRERYHAAKAGGGSEDTTLDSIVRDLTEAYGKWRKKREAP